MSGYTSKAFRSSHWFWQFLWIWYFWPSSWLQRALGVGQTAISLVLGPTSFFYWYFKFQFHKKRVRPPSPSTQNLITCRDLVCSNGMKIYWVIITIWKNLGSKVVYPFREIHCITGEIRAIMLLKIFENFSSYLKIIFGINWFAGDWFWSLELKL